MKSYIFTMDAISDIYGFQEYISAGFTNTSIVIRQHYEERIYMKATGIVRRVDDLGRIVIPKEIRRTLRIREGDPLLTTLTPFDRFCWAIHSLAERITAE